MDALDLLKRQHEELRELIDRLGEAATLRETRRLADLLALGLDRHAMIEERAFYPELRRYAEAELGAQALDALEMHAIVRRLCADLRVTDEADPSFDAKVRVLAELVGRHFSDEEQSLFPRVRTLIARDDLRVMSETLRLAIAAAEGRPSAPPEERTSTH